jgi:hypothetical protein
MEPISISIIILNLILGIVIGFITWIMGKDMRIVYGITSNWLNNVLSPIYSIFFFDFIPNSPGGYQ